MTTPLIPDLVRDLDDTRRRLQAAELRILRLPAGSVGADQIDWAQMPPVRLASWTSADDGKMLVTSSGSPASLAGSDLISTIQALLPSRPGYNRQYNISGLVVHVGVGGETAWSFTLDLHSGAVPGAALAATGLGASVGSSDVATKVWSATSGWVANSTLDSLSDLSRVSLYGTRNYVGAAPTLYMRTACLNGRYVPA